MATPQVVARSEAALRELRTRRERAEQRSEDTATLEAALVAAERDIDARTSPELEAVREEIQALEEEITDAFARVDDNAAMNSRLAAAGYTVASTSGRQRADATQRALAEVAQVRADLGRES